MKYSFRATLLTLLLGLLSVTVAGLAYTAHRNARAAVDDLSAQVLQHAAGEVAAEVRGLVRAANDVGALNAQLLHSGKFRPQDLGPVARYWRDVMTTQPRLTRLSFGREADGEWYYLRRTPDGRLAVGELRRNPHSGRLELSDYWAEDYPNGRFYFNPDMDAEDPRRRPWYVAARRAGRQTWSESYVFFGVGGVADLPGVSCATPVYDEDGTLLGVLTSSFGLDQVSAYLQGLSVGRGGYAFVVEARPDSPPRVIAHPRPELLLRAARAEGGAPVRELVPAAELGDPSVPALLAQLPGAPDPAALPEPVQVRFDRDGVGYLGRCQALAGEGVPRWLIGVVLPEAEVLEEVQRSHRHAVAVGLAVLLAALLAALYLSRQVARPLEQLGREAEAIGQWRIEARPVVPSIVLEVHRLGQATEDMKAGLRSFQKYVPADLARQLVAAGQEARLGGESRLLTIFFCDIADFTAVSEALTPAQLVAHLGEYLQALSEEVLAAGGTVDKYIGDALMAFWGAPAAHPGHALAACTAALRCQQRLARLRARWEAEGKPPLRARIGIHSGEAVVGNIGSETRLNYTVIGDAVNLASRVEGLNKYYGTATLITEDTYRGVSGALLARPVDWVSVKGKQAAVLVYELLGPRGEASREEEGLAALCGRALESYRRRDWEEALRLLGQVLELRPADRPAGQLAERCRRYQAEPPGEAWDGVHRMESK
jgi:adenylate cyclase